MTDLACEAPLAALHPDDAWSDAWLGPVLVATWALHTGRVLRSDVPVDALTADELIAFWADPLLDETPQSPLCAPAARQPTERA
jgi:hypothetical protein